MTGTTTADVDDWTPPNPEECRNAQTRARTVAERNGWWVAPDLDDLDPVAIGITADQACEYMEANPPTRREQSDIWETHLVENVTNLTNDADAIGTLEADSPELDAWIDQYSDRMRLHQIRNALELMSRRRHDHRRERP